MPDVEEENPWSFDSEKNKKKKKKYLEGIERDWRRRQNFEEQCSDSFLLLNKNDLYRSGGIEPRIEKAIETGSNDQEESKKESNQAMSFGLKTALFQSVKKQVWSIETWKLNIYIYIYIFF